MFSTFIYAIAEKCLIRKQIIPEYNGVFNKKSIQRWSFQIGNQKSIQEKRFLKSH